MQVIILDDTKDYKNEADSITKMFAAAEEKFRENQLFFSHLLVDETEVYENHFDYVSDHLADINRIEFIAQSQLQYLHQSLLSTKEYLNRAVPEVKNLANQFYQGNQDSAWVKFAQLVEGVELINDLLQSAGRLQHLIRFENNLSGSNVEMKAALNGLEEALQTKDVILIGDCLLYELTPVLESISSIINQIIDNEVVPNDFN